MPWLSASSWYCANTQRNLDNNSPVYTNRSVFFLSQRENETTVAYGGFSTAKCQDGFADEAHPTHFKQRVKRAWANMKRPRLWLVWRRQYHHGNSGLRYAPSWSLTINIVYVLLYCTLMPCLLCRYATWLRQLSVWSLSVLLLATLVVSKLNKGSSCILNFGTEVCLNAAVQAVKLLQITQLLWWSIGVRRDINDPVLCLCLEGFKNICCTRANKCKTYFHFIFEVNAKCETDGIWYLFKMCCVPITP